MFSHQWGRPASSSGSGGKKSASNGRGTPGWKRKSGGGGGGGRGGGRVRDAKTPRLETFDGVSFTLHSVDTLAITSKYSERLNDIWRNHGGTFNKDLKSWVLPLSRYRTVLADLGGDEVRELPPMISRRVDGTGTFIPPTKRTSEREARAAWEKSLPPRLRESLMPFQEMGVTLAIQRGGRILLGDEMGLGKTLQALSVAYHYNAEWPLLIICPSSLRFTWQGEITKWLGIETESIQIISSGKQKPESLIVIVSYDIAARIPKALAGFSVVIADEAHYLKSPDAKRTKAITPLIRKAKRALLLTGTPALSRPIELFTLLNGLEPEMFGSAVQFGIRYAAGFQGNFGWDFTGASNLTELHVVLANTVLIRRLKKDVLQQLPPKSRQQVFIEVAAKSKKELAALTRQRSALDEKIKSSTGSSRQVAENEQRALTVRLYSMTGLAKIPGAIGYLDELLDRDIKLLIFAHHREVLDAISAHLSQKKVRHIRIDGQTPQHLRQELCTKFQEDTGTKAAVLSITAAGVGLTLHAASTVVFCELFWNPGQLLQAEDRAHRMGQKKSVDIKYVIGRGTLDDSQWQLVQRKISIVGQSVNGAAAARDLELDGQEGGGASIPMPDHPTDQLSLSTFLKSKGVHDIVERAAASTNGPTGPAAAPPSTVRCDLCSESVPPEDHASHVAACAMALADGVFDDD